MLRDPQHQAAPLLEVIALTPADAAAAQEGGADRLEIVSDMAADGLSPTPATLAAIRAECDLPLRVMVRTDPDFVCRDLAALIDLAGELTAVGADGLVLGFLTAGALDVACTVGIAEACGLPWTCHRAVDHATDYAAAVVQAAELPGLDQILTAGAPGGLGDGLPVVIGHAALGPLMAGGGLSGGQVPELRRAGVAAFHIGSAARADWGSPVDAGRVAAWRSILDG